jgi:Ribosomal L30 N-terminal domain
MAEEEQTQLNYVVETVLKKRKAREDWSIKKKEILDAKKKRNDDYKSTIKRPEQFVKEYRDKVSEASDLFSLLPFLWRLIYVLHVIFLVRDFVGQILLHQR